MCGSRAFALAKHGRVHCLRARSCEDIQSRLSRTHSLFSHGRCQDQREKIMWLSIRLERLSPVGYVGSTLGRSLWNLSVCGKFSHVARSPSGLRPIKKCRCCQHPVATTFLGAACPDLSDTHPSCHGFEIAQVGLLPFIDRRLRKSGTESSSVVTGATDTEKAAEQTNEPPATHAEKQRAERERENRGRKEKKSSPEKRTSSREQQANQTHRMDESSVPGEVWR